MLLLEQFPNLMFVFNKYLLFQKVFLYSQEQYFLKKRITDRIFQGINGDYICRRERYWETHIKENIIFSSMTTTIHQCKKSCYNKEKILGKICGLFIPYWKYCCFHDSRDPFILLSISSQTDRELSSNSRRLR